MPSYRISQAARLLGVSDDTVRRWADSGRLSVSRGEGGRMVVDGADLAALASSQEAVGQPSPIVGQSARNHLTGIVTRVVRDNVMAQVDIAAGPFRVVALVSREAVDQLSLEPGVMVVASIKATNVTVELPIETPSS